MVERKVGEVFRLSTGARLLVRPCLSCRDYDLYEGPCNKVIRDLFEEVGECGPFSRSDRTSVVFVHELDWTLDEILKVAGMARSKNERIINGIRTKKTLKNEFVRKNN